MNILASYDWLKEYLNGAPGVDEFVRRMTEVGNSVEHLQNISKSLDRMVVGKIVEVKPHPNADKLRVVVTDVGETHEIVCGGSNLEVGHLVAVALPGAMVRWHGEGELVEIKEAELRGVKSYGMICAPGEIGFEKLQKGEKEIWDLTDVTDAKPGTPLAQALGLDDVIFDIEVTTNRPDAMSIVGLAREAGAAGLGAFKPLTPFKPLQPSQSSKLSVTVESSDLCPRYQAVVIEGVKVGPSPWWMQKRLLLSGHRPINNVVDVTNYVLHELGQPLHAFDADKLEGEKIIVRTAKKGEKILALDGKEYELDASMLVIADAQKPVAVAGVMGGELTGTKESTTRLVIEAATFDPVSVRRTSRSLTLYSDSSSLFEKGLSTESTSAALARAVELICELTGGHVASEVIDQRAKPYESLVFPYDPQKVSDLIGIDVPVEKQAQILQALGFVVEGNQITVPYWRDHDIEASVDFTEEVARMVGYGNLPSVLPTGVLPTPIVEPIVIWERRLKEILRAAGMTELYSVSLVSADILTKLDIDPAQAVRVQNPLSEDGAYLRTSLWPTLLVAVEENQHRFDAAELFEIAAVHQPVEGDIPLHQYRLALAVYDTDGARAYRRAKGLLERMLSETGVVDFTIEASQTVPYFHPGRSAVIRVGSEAVGTIGELAPFYASRFGIDRRLCVVDVNLDRLLPHLGLHQKYQPLPAFPDTVRDVSFVLDERAIYADVQKAIASADSLIVGVELLDVYQGKGIEPGKKSMAFRLQLRAEDHTLSSEEAEAVMQKVVEMLQSRFGAMIR